MQFTRYTSKLHPFPIKFSPIVYTHRFHKFYNSDKDYSFSPKHIYIFCSTQSSFIIVIIIKTLRRKEFSNVSTLNNGIISENCLRRDSCQDADHTQWRISTYMRCSFVMQCGFDYFTLRFATVI